MSVLDRAIETEQERSKSGVGCFGHWRDVASRSWIQALMILLALLLNVGTPANAALASDLLDRYSFEMATGHSLSISDGATSSVWVFSRDQDTAGQDSAVPPDVVGLRMQLVFTTLSISFGILFLVLFYFLPSDRSYVYFAGLLLSFGAAVFFDFQNDFSPAYWELSVQRGMLTLGLLLSLLFIYESFLPELPRSFAFVGGAVFLAGVSAVWRPESNFDYLMITLVLFWIESSRVLIGASRRRSDGSWTMAAGFATFFVCSTYDVLLDSNLIDSLGGITNGYQFGFLGLCLAAAIFLARSIARSNDALVANKIKIREQELERRLLDAEMSRKTKELEDARALQLSMLPIELPSIPGLDIAAYMNT
ncbi:MAG: hypothetical protein HKN13_01690, partial [Rhodothermales bacterium]|nr:hypothetical protein [Rhodothermales bacterium]